MYKVTREKVAKASKCREKPVLSAVEALLLQESGGFLKKNSYLQRESFMASPKNILFGLAIFGGVLFVVLLICCLLSNNSDTVEGQWIAEDLEVMITKKNSSSWRLSAKVANIISATITRTEGGGLSVRYVSSTKMMPRPHLWAKERAFVTLLNNLTDLRLEGTNLALVARESVQILSPAVPPPPVTREKIRWLN